MSFEATNEQAEQLQRDRAVQLPLEQHHLHATTQEQPVASRKHPCPTQRELWCQRRPAARKRLAPTSRELPNATHATPRPEGAIRVMPRKLSSLPA